MVINNSLISDNSATSQDGGGISNRGNILILNNSTVSGNTAGDRGGGIYSVAALQLNNSTITSNSALTGGLETFDNLATIQNSIIAGNIGATTNDCLGAITSLGFNLVGNSCSLTAANGDMTGIDPNLDPLQDNGGLTFTHALLPGSPAIDAGNPAGCTDQDGDLLSTDQRGVSRPQGAACDIGAFELETDVGETMEVSIDIRPGNRRNQINPHSGARIHVAILSTPDFDVLIMVDRSTLTFGSTGEEESLVSCKRRGRDVNRDGLPDLICEFRIRAAVFQPGDTAGMLNGLTVDGQPLTGQDFVKIKGGSEDDDD